MCRLHIPFHISVTGRLMPLTFMRLLFALTLHGMP